MENSLIRDYFVSCTPKDRTRKHSIHIHLVVRTVIKFFSYFNFVIIVFQSAIFSTPGFKGSNYLIFT